ncbi:hypothetical protein N302_13873, partial [Corvus brachyrhynchos]
EAAGPTGQIWLKVNFSMGDLDSWKETARRYHDDPSGAAKRFGGFVKALDPDWENIDLMLDALTDTEKELVLKSARTHVQAQIAAQTLQGTIDDYVPMVKPRWDCNNPDHYQLLKRYLGWIKFGLENAIPKSVNWGTLYAIKQNATETPMEFLD